jgi:XTP/dITP diphosphohydrolase
MSLTLVTSNAKKAAQFATWLGMPLAHRALELPELQTMDGTQLVTEKARAAYALLGKPLLVEDTSLGLDGMKGLPGPFTKFFLEAGGPELLCRLADLTTDRAATYTVWIAIADASGIRVVSGSVHGHIASAPHGSGGFGFDRCFVPDGHGEPRAALDEDAFAMTSARKRAIDALRDELARRPVDHGPASQDVTAVVRPRV